METYHEILGTKNKIDLQITAADTCFYFSEKISRDMSCESSALQMIHMKYHILLSLKNNIKKG